MAITKQEIFDKLLEIRELSATVSKESKVPKEQRDYSQVAKVIDSTLYRLGYKKPRTSTINQEKPSATIFIDRKLAKDAEILAHTEDEVNSQKKLDEAKKKQVKQLNSGKKKNATKKQTEQIRILYQGGKTVEQISDDLNLLEDTIYSTLGIDINNSGVLLADNTGNND